MLASMVVALTVTPALCLLLLDRARIEHRESPLVPWLKRHYAAALSRDRRAPRATSSRPPSCSSSRPSAVWPFLGQSLLPEFKERDFLMHWVPPEGTSHPETFRITRQPAASCAPFPACATSAPISVAQSAATSPTA